MRIATGLVMAALGIGCAYAVTPEELAAVRVVTPFSLDTPGAMSALKTSNPGHYARAVAILELASEMPCEGEPRILQTQVEAARVACRPANIYTSLPAKRDVTFVLDDTLYRARVVLREREKLEPVQPSR